MDIWHIRGGNRLDGECCVQGSKNASLPILAASLISPGTTELMNVPNLRDVNAALRILRHLGCRAEQDGSRVYIDSAGVSCSSIPPELMVEMRSSVIFMGALLARCGRARLSLPGGCQLGKRPIDIHLSALRQLGAVIEENNGEIRCESSGLKGCEIFMPFPSVGATENIMLAACGAKGKTVIHGGAKEPEIVALQGYLRRAGAVIDGAGTDNIEIQGPCREKSIAFRIIPDRIAASTLACAAACVGGNVELKGVDPRHFSTVLYFLKEAGCDIISSNRSVRIRSSGKLRAVGNVETSPYPGFPTDAQPVLMAAMLKADGETVINETIFENRYRQVPELRRLGADISLSGRICTVRGVPGLTGSALSATDLRGGAAMIVAGLSADRETVIFDEGHVRRGYDSLDSRLRSLGADIYLEH